MRIIRVISVLLLLALVMSGCASSTDETDVCNEEIASYYEQEDDEDEEVEALVIEPAQRPDASSPEEDYNENLEPDNAEDEQCIEEEELDVEEAEVFTFENGREGLPVLDASLREKIAGLGGSYSIYVKNLNTNEYLLINNRSQEPASLLKLFGFAYGFEAIEQGRLERTPQIDIWLDEMITISCNDGYNHMLVATGAGNVLEGARRATEFAHSLGFTETTVGGTLHPSVFDYFHFAGLFTSARDVGHLLEKIYRGTLVSEEASKEMMTILLAQQRLNKIPTGLPPGTISASKTGEIPGIEHDAAIVFSENANFVLVIMTEYAPSAIAHIHTISGMVYQYFNP